RLVAHPKALGVRKVSADQVIGRLRRKLAQVPGATLFLQSVQDIRVGGRVTGSLYQYTLQGENLTDLLDWAPRMLDKLKGLPELRDVGSDQQNRGLEASLVIDRDTVSRLGILPQAIDDTLYDAFGQRLVSTIFTQLNQYHVVLEVDPRFKQNPDALKNIYVRAATGDQVPLTAFTHMEPMTAPLSLNHQGQFPAVTISFNLAPGASLGDAVKGIQQVENDIQMPKSIQTSFEGT